MREQEPQATDLIVAVVFLALIAGGSAWLVHIVNDRFAAAVVDHFIGLARGAGR